MSQFKEPFTWVILAWLLVWFVTFGLDRTGWWLIVNALTILVFAGLWLQDKYQTRRRK